MLSRNWTCMNPRCRTVFHSFEHGNPPCPQCGCVRVSWIPGGGHMAKQAPGVDATLKQLAHNYGMTDINSPSPSRLNRAMPKHDNAVADGPILNFAPGFSAPYNRAGRATSGWSVNNVNFRVTTPAEKALATAKTYPRMGRDHWHALRTPYRG